MTSPLVIPDAQIESLKIICDSENEDILFVPDDVSKFREGQLVRVVHGAFEGVTGRVARYRGQQRVAVVVDGLFSMATAYVPSAFLEKL